MLTAAGVPPDHHFFLFLKSRRVSKGPESMTLGQRVIGRNADGWYYHCTIIGMATQIFYEVNFDDGSYCDNLFPENVLVSVSCPRTAETAGMAVKKIQA